MPLTSFRAQAPRRVISLSYVLQHNRSATPISATACRPRQFQILYQKASRRYLSNESKPISIGQDLLRASPSIEDIRLKTEFEENKNIRDYLRKWQDINFNHLDPVRGPETSNILDPSEPWVGNMLNDNQEACDAGGDTVRVNDEDLADFVHIADEGEGIHDFLEPGDLVALSTSEGILRFAIYVRSIYKQQQFYTERGKWRIAFARDLDFVVKRFAPPESVAALHPYFPESLAKISPEMQSAIEGGVPRAVGASLLQMINSFDAQVQELYRANSIRLDRIHEIVADEERELQFTLEELACKALDIEADQLNDVIRYTVHQAVRQNPFLMESDQSSLFTNHYTVQPVRVATILDTVSTWVHEHQDLLVRAMTGKEAFGLKDHPLHQFVQKAQRLIRLSRKVRSPTTMASVGPTAQRFRPGQDNKPAIYREMLTEKFNHNDRLIIQFLQLWCIPPRRMTSSTLRSAGSHIMRATGFYNALELNSGSAPLFLQELGVFLPWENLRLFDPDLALPGHGVSLADSMWTEVHQAFEKLDADGLVDKMADLRTDWGDLPVYCVDSVDAEEIDDGVSLERIPGSDDVFWIHIHIANPSAFLDPEGSIMKYAASRMQTLYVPERTYPMLPSVLTQKYFSLASGRPTLTFSAKMDLNGQVLDTNISNGIVRNVIYITHDKLRSILKSESDEPMKPLTVGGEVPQKHSRSGLRESVTPEDEDTFHTLRQLMLAFREHRLKNGAMEWPLPSDTSISVSVGDVPFPPSKLDVSSGRYILGDPIIQLRPQAVDPHEIPDLTKHNLISTLMNLACWISAKWCAERNIPAVYDGTYYHPEYPPLTNQNLSSYGGDTWLQLGAPKGISSSKPIPHTPLGLNPYVKSTSPLRRYTDLLVHQQIEAALRFEHEHRNSQTKELVTALPFSSSDVDNYISRSRWKRNRLRSCDQGSKQFWACMLLFRAFYFAECELPETFQCLVHRPYSQTSLAGTQYGQGFSGVITSLGVRCQITIPPGLSDEVNILSVVEGKITAVDMSRMIVSLEAIRVVKGYERVGEWR